MLLQFTKIQQCPVAGKAGNRYSDFGTPGSAMLIEP